MKENDDGTMVFECSGRSFPDLIPSDDDTAFSPVIGEPRIAIGETHRVFPRWGDNLSPEERQEFAAYMTTMWTNWAKEP